MKVKIAEIFKSICGEGKQQGLPCTFIRLAGCNLRCSWCDTTYAQSETPATRKMDVKDVIRDVGKLNKHLLRYIKQPSPDGDSKIPTPTYSPARVCITGGEPLVQWISVLRLAKALKKLGYFIILETNGSRPITKKVRQVVDEICMDVKMPSAGEWWKDHLDMAQSNIPWMDSRDVVKVVVGDLEDLNEASRFVHDRMLQSIKCTEDAPEVHISPMTGKDGRFDDLYWLTALFVDCEILFPPSVKVRLVTQLHKVVSVR